MKRNIMILIAGVVLLAVAAAPAQSAWDFERISDNSGQSYNPAVGVTLGNIFVV